MRRLLWLTVGFAAACVVGVYVTAGNWLLLMGLFSVLAGIPLFFLKTKHSTQAAIALFGCLVGFLWLWGYHQLYLNTVKDYDGQTVEATVELSDYSYETSYGIAADGRIVLEGKQYQIRTYLVGTGELKPGDTVTGKLRLRMTVEGGKQAATHHQGDGIFLLGYMDKDCQIREAASVPNRYLPAKWRQDILQKIDQIFPQDTAAFAKALLLGERYDLSYEQDTAFKLSGIRHVIAVSGLHVSILFSFVYTLVGKQRHLTALIGIPVLFLFAAAAGFSPSIVRACTMQTLVIIAMLVDKEYDPPTALAFSVLAMLLCNPITITSVSFQLSVGCMIGIFGFSNRIHGYLLRGKRKEWVKGRSLRARILRWCASTVSMTLGAMITTTPLAAWYFGTVSLVGVLTNLLTLWAITFVFCGIILAVGLGFIWLPLGEGIAFLISFPMRYVLIISRWLAKFPLAAVYTCSVYIVLWLVFAYVAFFFLLHSKKKQPVLAVTAILLCLCLCVGLSYIEPKMDDYRVAVFDVGQGQCILIQSHDENYLVDCGGDSATNTADQVAQHLLSQGITRLDGLFLTHFDRDHAEGAPLLLSRIPAEKLYLPDVEDTGAIRQTLSEQYAGRISWIRETVTLETENFQITLFAPKGTEDKNENCMCLLFQRGNYDILITGDRNITGEKYLLRQGQLPKVELLIIGHHGSADSTGYDLLNQIKPTTAVISVGRDNYHNHPAEETLMRLTLYQVTVYRTDRQGTIIFRG